MLKYVTPRFWIKQKLSSKMKMKNMFLDRRKLRKLIARRMSPQKVCKNFRLKGNYIRLKPESPGKYE